MIRYIGEPTMSLLKNILHSAERSLGCVLTGLSTFFAPISVSIICVAGFITIDWFLGYTVSRKFKRKQIESNKIWKTVSKAIEAVLLIVGAYVIDLYIVTSLDLRAVEFVSGTICFAEFISWLESMTALHPNSKICKLLNKVVRSKAEKYLEIKIEDKDLQINTNNNDNSNVNS